MIDRFLQFVKRPTSIHVIINTFGNYLNVFFTALFALVLVRVMTPSEYGVLSVLLGISYVLANALDFGTTATIYSYVPTLLEDRSGEIYHFIKTTFFYLTLFASLVICVLFFIFPYLDRIFFKTNAPELALNLTLLSVVLFIWQNYFSNILYAAKQFLKVNLYVNLSNLIKSIVLFSLIPFDFVNVTSVIFVFGVLGSTLFFIPLIIEKHSLIRVIIRSKIDKGHFRFAYTLSYFIGMQFFNMGLRMDLFLLSYFGLRQEVGYYGLAQKIIVAIMTSIVSITQVLSPNFSRIETKKAARSMIKTSLLYLAIPAGLFFLVYLTPDKIYHLFFTERFAQTSAIAKSLVFPFIFYSLSVFLWLFILYTAKKPGYFLFSQLVFFIGMTVGCYLLIPKMGVFAPPAVIAVSIFVSSLILGTASLYEYKKLPN